MRKALRINTERGKKSFDLNNNAVDQEFSETWRYRNG